MKAAEEILFNRKFPNEEYDADNFYDWAAENANEAFNLCLELANELSKYQLLDVEGLRPEITRMIAGCCINDASTKRAVGYIVDILNNELRVS